MKPLVVAATSIKFKSAFLHEFNIYCLQGSKFVNSWHKGCLHEVFDNMFRYASNIHCYKTRYTAKKNLYKMSVRTNVARQTINCNLFYSYRHLEGPSNSFKKLKFVCISKEIIHYLLSEQQIKYATCVASRFWLGTQCNKGVWGQRNSEEIGAGAMRNRLHGQVAFLSSPNACVWVVPFGSECSPANQLFGNLLWESSNWLNHNLLRKTESTYQRSVDRSVVSLEYSMEKQGNCINAWTGNEKKKKKRCYGNFVLIENLYDHNFTSKKYYVCRQPDFVNVVTELYSNGA